MTTTPTLTYRLIPGGYEILSDGVLWIHQPFDPTKPGMVPYTPAEADAAARAFIASQEPAPQPPAKPLSLILTSLTCEAPQAIVNEAAGEATIPKASKITARGEVRINGAVIAEAFTGAFRLPIIASDGRERIILATITKGLMEAHWTPSESGKWRITEAGINSALPADRQMTWRDLTVYVLD